MSTTNLGSILFLCVSISLTNSLPVDPLDDILDLTIIHVNDIHSHFEENNKYGGRCNEDLREKGECYGGEARLLTKVNEIRNNSSNPENIIFLNAGDFYTGTIWYEEFKYEVVEEFSNMLSYDAAALGNHDFDDGNMGLTPFIDGANFPMLAANLDHDLEEGFNSHRSTIKTVGNNMTIGIIGYVTTDTPGLSKPGANLRFLDEIQAVQLEATYLKNEERVDIIIALGHSGYDLDMKLAKDIPEVDIVVGGHSHTLLWPPEIDLPPDQPQEPSGPYPTYITQDNGKVVPVVQAYCYSKYLGYFEVHFNASGDLLSPVDGMGVTNAMPILLDNTIAENETFKNILETYKNNNLTDYYEEVGSTNVLLLSHGQAESNLGDLIADAMVYSWKDNDNNADIAFANNGGIRSNIMEGNITVEDLWNVLPFGDTIDILPINGTGLRTVLEHYASFLCLNESCYAPTFLQVSSTIKIEYRITSENSGSRIEKIQTNSSCSDKSTWFTREDPKQGKTCNCLK